MKTRSTRLGCALNGAPRIEYPAPGGVAAADVRANESSRGELTALWRVLELRRRPSPDLRTRQAARAVASGYKMLGSSAYFFNML